MVRKSFSQWAQFPNLSENHYFRSPRNLDPPELLLVKQRFLLIFPVGKPGENTFKSWPSLEKTPRENFGYMVADGFLKKLLGKGKPLSNFPLAKIGFGGNLDGPPTISSNTIKTFPLNPRGKLQLFDIPRSPGFYVTSQQPYEKEKTQKPIWL